MSMARSPVALARRDLRRETGRRRHVRAGTDVLVFVAVEGLAVLGEVPLNGLVHELAVATPELERDDGGKFLGALGHVLVWPT
jgi:hypothetical protein